MPLLRIPCPRVLVLLPDLWQGLTVSIAKLEAHGTSPKAGGMRPLRGLSFLRSFLPALAPSVYRCRPQGRRARPTDAPHAGAGADNHQRHGEKGETEGHGNAGGQSKGAGNHPKGGRAPKRASPCPPAFPGARQAREGVKPRKPKARTTHRGEGEMRAVSRAGEKAAKGATGRAAQGAGAARCPRRAAFFSHSLEGVGTPAAHCGAGPHAGRRRGPHGDAPSRPRGPPARHATAGP